MLSEDGFVLTKAQRRASGRKRAPNLVRSLKPVDFYNDMELMAVPTGSVFVFDSECYRNFYYLAFKNIETGKVLAFERSPDFDFNATKLKWFLWRYCIVGFNSINYDIPIMEYAMAGAANDDLKEASDYIIKSGIAYGTKKITQYDFQKAFKVRIGNYNHIDLFNVCPVNQGLTAKPASLKLYAGRLHAARMQDLPFDEAHVLTREDAEVTRLYCCNDLDNTQLLLKELQPAIDLRSDMTKEYNVELRSKSDAQVAEAVINAELTKVLGYAPRRPEEVDVPDYLQYEVPSFIGFKSPQLLRMLDIVRNAKFHINALGEPILPAELEDFKVEINGKWYTMGMGGLHSNEKKTAHIANEDILIIDTDVASYYPKIILNQKLYPKHLGPAFLRVYQQLVDTRLIAKEKSKDKSLSKAERARWKGIADSLKITINGSFGKLGNKYSTLYAPQLMLQVTLTGQLCLLMLIEMLEFYGIEVIQANTDGVVSKFAKSRQTEMRQIVKMWEQITNFEMEETQYKALYSQDVNNYIAIKMEGDPEGRFIDQRLGVKTKGIFCERGSAADSVLSKNPETLVCNDALIAYLATGKPIVQTIMECKDFKRFTAVKAVAGGGEKGGVFLGKVVRWYYPKNEPGSINYSTNGNKVGKSDGARPVMDMPEEFPSDIDYSKYVAIASEMLYKIGALRKAEIAKLF